MRFLPLSLQFSVYHAVQQSVLMNIILKTILILTMMIINVPPDRYSAGKPVPNILKFGLRGGLEGVPCPDGTPRRKRVSGGTPLVDLGQKKCFNCLFVKLKFGNNYYFNINNYLIFFSYLNAYNL